VKKLQLVNVKSARLLITKCNNDYNHRKDKTLHRKSKSTDTHCIKSTKLTMLTCNINTFSMPLPTNSYHFVNNC